MVMVVSVLSIESLGVKHYRTRLVRSQNLCFSTLHRVVGGETVLSISLRKERNIVSVLSIESLGVKQDFFFYVL